MSAIHNSDCASTKQIFELTAAPMAFSAKVFKAPRMQWRRLNKLLSSAALKNGDCQLAVGLRLQKRKVTR
ncbi:hypothetical protein ACTXT7_007171 [Hymenolepis weldensis]